MKKLWELLKAFRYILSYLSYFRPSDMIKIFCNNSIICGATSATFWDISKNILQIKCFSKVSFWLCETFRNWLVKALFLANEMLIWRHKKKFLRHICKTEFLTKATEIINGAMYHTFEVNAEGIITRLVYLRTSQSCMLYWQTISVKANEV
jgi:hypothetical protein